MRRKGNVIWKYTIGMAVIMILLYTCVLTGCSRKLTPKKVMTFVSKNMVGITSFSNTVELDIELEDVLYTTAVTLDITLENTLEPQAGHALGNAHVKMRGAELDSVLEIYQVIEEGQHVTYSSLDGNWTREVEEQAESSGMTLDSSLFAKMEESMDEFRIAEQTVEVGGKECYQMYGEVMGKDLLGLIGSPMLHAYGLVTLPDESAILESMIPITFEVYVEEMRPARIIMDLTDVMNGLYEEVDKSTNVNNFMIELAFTGYDEVPEIRVPQEIAGRNW
ncbi:MAG: hypothetical protein HFH24_12180 [Ruminococcus sp.]|nr:hypothetical protein [Ruminococcus sp.]